MQHGMARRLSRSFVLALVCCSAQGQAPTPAQPRDPQLDAQIERLLRLAFDKPELALQQLYQLQRAETRPPAQLQLSLAEGRLQVLAGQQDAALQTAQRLEGQPGLREGVLLLRAERAERLGQTEQAAELAGQALPGLQAACPAREPAAGLAPECDYRSLWATLRLLERAQYRAGALPQAERSAREGLALAQAAQDRHLSASSMGSLAMLSQMQDLPEQAARWLQQARQMAQGDLLAQVKVRSYEAIVAGQRQDTAAKLRALEEGLALARQADATRWISQTQGNLADAYLTLGRPARALELAGQALPALLRRGDLRLERTLRFNMALAHVQLRQFDAARRQIERIDELRKGQADQGLRSLELRELGDAWAAAGQTQPALAAYHEERRLQAELQERNRSSALQQLKLKYDSERKQRDLDLLRRERELVDQQLANRGLARQVGLALGVLLGLSLLLAVWMVRRVRASQRLLRANEILLREQSERDPLTELANRRHFLARMERLPLASEVGFSGALLMVDVDHFKRINDGHGHAAGDRVICELARRLSGVLRSQDLVVRWGGEEFLIHAPALDTAGVLALAERVLRVVGERPVDGAEGPLHISVSLGCARFPLAHQPQRRWHWEQALNWVDRALLLAKAEGRNRAACIQGLRPAEPEQDEAGADFDAALASGRLDLRFISGPAVP